MAAPVVIRVGCALDTSVEKSFREYEKRAESAAKRAGQALGKGGRARGGVGVTDTAVVAAAKATEQKVTATVKTEAKKQLQEWRAIIRARLAANKNYLDEMQISEARATAKVLAEERKRERATKASASRSARELDRFATRTSHRSTRFLMPNAPLASMGRRALSDVMRGIGVDASISGAVGRVTSLSKGSAALSTSGYIAGAAGAAGRRVDPAKLQSEARALGKELVIDPQQVIEAGDQFVKLTGDLDTARQMMGFFGRLSIATNSDLGEMSAMAGEVSNALGDMPGPEKIEAIRDVMKDAAAKGKLNSVEIRDFAKYYSHLGGTAGSFAAPRSQTLKEFASLVQLAKETGGATGAATATRSISGLGNTFATKARIKQFEKYGVNLRDKNLVRSPIAIIKEALTATQGDAVKMKDMFSNVIGAKPAVALGNIYNAAGGGASGLAAIDAKLKEMADKSSMSDAAISEAVAVHKGTAASKALDFQNKLDEVAEKAMASLLPALEKLAPQALKLADSLGRLVTWAAENPGQAIVKAIVFSIARAGLESAGRAAIERAIFTIFNGIRPPMGGGGLLPPIGGTGAPAGAAGAGRGAAGAAGGAAGGALYSAGVASIPAAAGAFLAWDSYNSLQGNRRGGPNQTGADEGLDSWVNFLTGGVVGAIGSKLGGASWEESAMQLTHAKIGKGAWEAGSWMFGGAGAKAPSFMTDFTGEGAANKAAKEERSRMDAELAKLTASNEAVQRAVSGTLNVNIVSDATARSSPTTNPAGREPPGS